MPLIAFARSLFGLLSLILLGICAYLLWNWYEGYLWRDSQGLLHLAREDWRLWIGLALLAWSLAGRLILTPFLAGGEKGPPSNASRGEGRMVAGASGANLYVENAGPADAPVIVLTHGWGLDSTIWSYAKRDLSTRRLILWDLPGLGRSKLAKGRSVSLDDFAADLGTVIDLAGDRPVVLVGHSIGGMTIQTFARDNPEQFARRVAGVVLINTSYTNPLTTMILSPLVTAPALAVDRADDAADDLAAAAGLVERLAVLPQRLRPHGQQARIWPIRDAQPTRAHDVAVDPQRAGRAGQG